MFGDPFQPMAQPRFEQVDRLLRGFPLSLGPHQPAVDVEVALRDDGLLYRRIAMFGNPNTGVQHRPVRETPELADLGACVIDRAGKLAARGHVDLDSWWQFCFVAHDLLLRRESVCGPGPKVTAQPAQRQNSHDRPAQPPLNPLSTRANTGSGAA
ncbi:hypothetical protein LAUMK41_00859 [Mycobacterium attenuatum]|nr:hypothetical protein LAUMK41_00859 [Mycobacterium attenuatum]